jgi:ribosomal protein S18 acetylase RimI-like enzyme
MVLNMKNTIIRKIQSEEIDKAKKLSLKVFLECSSSDFDEEGLNTFKKFLNDKDAINSVTIYGAFISKELIGIIGTKHLGSHISLFFIDKQYQGLGIGRKLFEFAKKDSNANYITVSSSTHAVEIYQRLGFVKISEIQRKDGISSISMQYGKEKALSVHNIN